MKNPFATLKAAWKDPKKKPWILAGAGATTGVAVLALRRPSDPDEQVAESVAAEGGGGPIMSDAGIASGGELGGSASVPSGISYPYYDPGVGGGGGNGYYDPGLEEADFSEIHAAIDEQSAELEQDFAEQLDEERDRAKAVAKKARDEAKKQGKTVAGLETKVTTQGSKIEQQKKTNRKVRQKVNRLQRKVTKSSSKPRSKATSKPRTSKKSGVVKAKRGVVTVRRAKKKKAGKK